MTEPVFLIGLAIAGGTVVTIVKTIAAAVNAGNASKFGRSELDDLRKQLDDHAAALDDAQATLASQATQVSELHERVDFAERLLAQSRDRPALGPGDKREG